MDQPDAADQMPSGFHAKAAAKAAKLRKLAGRLASAALEAPGGLERVPGEWAPTQARLLREAPIAARPGHFELDLQYGPYSVAYDSTGRLLALSGKGGHVAAFEWRQKRLLFESQVNEACGTGLCWIGAGATPQLAVSQSNWTYVYDAQGLETHCLKRLHRANKLLWLERHWLMAACTDTGHLHWQDVSTGQTVGSYCAHHGPLRVAALHADSGCVLTGHPNGQLCLWTPLDKRPAVKMLCCPAGVRAVAARGHCVYTWGGDARLRLWDIRCLRPMTQLRVTDQAPHLAVSQRGLVAVPARQQSAVLLLPALHLLGLGAGEQDADSVARPLLSHPSPGRVFDLAFCPWEDALGFGHSRGVASILAPGAGEPNPDGALHPMAGRKQRREAEVRGLLDKLPAETIAPPGSAGLNSIDAEDIEETLERKRAAVMALPSEGTAREFQPRRRSGKAAGELQRKVGERWQRRRMELRQLLKSKRRVLADMAKAEKAAAVAAGGSKTAGRAAKKAAAAGGLTKPATGTFLDRLIPKAD